MSEWERVESGRGGEVSEWERVSEWVRGRGWGVSG